MQRLNGSKIAVQVSLRCTLLPAVLVHLTWRYKQTLILKISKPKVSNFN